MQEVRLSFTLHDIRDGEEPPSDGFYLIIEPKLDSISAVAERMWWDSEHHAWKLDEDSDSLFIPADYYGHTWTTDFLTEMIEKEVLI